MADDFDRELEDIAELVGQDEDTLQALRKRFEESALWHEHKRWHDQQGTQPHLVIEEEERSIEPAKDAAPLDQEPHVRVIKTGRCDCQPSNATMELDDKGVVVPGFPKVLGDARAYASSVDEPATYGSATPHNTYNGQHGGKDLYR